MTSLTHSQGPWPFFCFHWFSSFLCFVLFSCLSSHPLRLFAFGVIPWVLQYIIGRRNPGCLCKQHRFPRAPSRYVLQIISISYQLGNEGGSVLARPLLCFLLSQNDCIDRVTTRILSWWWLLWVSNSLSNWPSLKRPRHLPYYLAEVAALKRKN